MGIVCSYFIGKEETAWQFDAYDGTRNASYAFIEPQKLKSRYHSGSNAKSFGRISNVMIRGETPSFMRHEFVGENSLAACLVKE